MRRATLLVCVLGGTVLASLSRAADHAERLPAGPVLLLPAAGQPLSLRLDVVVAGQSPTVAWETFLDRLFDWFDVTATAHSAGPK
jgi:hypothetical protein